MADAGSELDATSRLNPVIRSYVYPPDKNSQKRFWLIYFCLTGVLMFIGGPVLEIFLVQPLITLLLQEAATITPDTACFDPRRANQTCPDDVLVEYYFWNMSNAESWLAGGEAPVYEEIGPYAFNTREVRYNLSYTDSWSSVEYSYHQYAEFLPSKSCAGCSMNDSLTSVNRAYLQFIAAGGVPPMGTDSETMVMSTLLPSSLKLSIDIISEFMTPLSGSTDPTTIYDYAVSQWSSCAPIEAVQGLYGLPTPFVKDTGVAPPGTVTYHPEFCQFVVETFQSMYGVDIQPSQFATYGVGLSVDAANAFLDLAVGASNVTNQDPIAQQFLYLFMLSPQDAVLQHLSAASVPQFAALSTIDANTWALLQGYVLRTMTDAGKVLFRAALAAGGGGLVVSRPLNEWLNGFEDPLLKLGAVAADPTLFHLRPWEYTPSLALTFSSADEPLVYFGLESYEELSWNRSDIGRFLPLIQHKRMRTGKAEADVPHTIDAYRGLRFRNESWGILRMAGQNEGVAVGTTADRSTPFVTFDSALSRSILTEYSGHDIQVKNIDSMLFTLANASIAPCNWTAYEGWADETGFSYPTYRAAINGLDESTYWAYAGKDGNETLMAHLFNVSAYFGIVDADSLARDRCMVPDDRAAAWDVSSTFACPTVYSLPRFLGADTWSNSTGVAAWNASLAQHAYGLAVEPLTGISVKGHKTYQLNHVVSRTPIMYPDIFVVSINGSASSSAQDSITVPIYWVRMSWEPKDADAYLLRAMKTLITYMYTILVIFWPSMGSVFAISSFLLLLLGKDAAERKKALAELGTNRGREVVMRSGSKKDSTRRRIHVDASPFDVDGVDTNNANNANTENDTSILQAVSEAVGPEYASDEEEFLNSAKLIV